MIAYTVSSTFNDFAVAEEWIAWLRDEHLEEVFRGGALDAEVIRFDGEPIRCEARYHFHSRQAFEQYEREHAPKLRAEGLRRFPSERGITYQRSLAEVVIPKSSAYPKQGGQ